MRQINQFFQLFCDACAVYGAAFCGLPIEEVQHVH